ncbi:hypothetical protein GCM10020218_055840 [Dactylosporangium vinaceum]
MTAGPPVPGVQLTVAWPVPGVAVTATGPAGATPLGSNGGAGTTVLEGALAAESPPAECATTVKVYATPFVSPPTSHVVPVVVSQVNPPGAAVTV